MKPRGFALIALYPLLAAGQAVPPAVPTGAADKSDMVVMGQVAVTAAAATPLPLSDSPTHDQLQSAQDTVFVQTAQSARAEARYLSALPTSGSGDAVSIQYHQAVQNYQDAINTVIDDNNTAAAPMREYHRLLGVAARAAKTADLTERWDLYGNFLNDSRLYLHDHPDATRLWVMRAAASLQLNKPATGGEAGRILLGMPRRYRADPHVQKLIALIRQKGWLANPVPPAPAVTAAQK
jgi:hypothetical protein